MHVLTFRGRAYISIDDGGNVMYPNRTYCDALHDLRKLVSKITIFNYKKSVDTIKLLVEELQVYGNRMEAGLQDKHDIHRYQIRRSELKKEIAELKKQLPEEEKSVDSLLGDLVDADV